MGARHVVVIGAGVGGVNAARAAAGAGARVTIVSNESPGGRAVWHSLLPSKVLLTVADRLGQSAHLRGLGLREVAAQPDPLVLVRRIGELSRHWSHVQTGELERVGVRFIAGRAAFADPHRLTVDGDPGPATSLEADAFIVATGSVPVFPPTLKPDGKRIMAPRFVSTLQRLPQSVVVVGAGPTGAEFVYGFNRLGAAVTWVIDEYGVLPLFDRDAAAVLVEALEHRGVVRHEGVAARSVVANEDSVTVTLGDGRAVSADLAFIALGRKPDVADLDMERAGLLLNPPRGLDVDQFCRSAVSHIYGVGDVAGPPFIANKAMAQGWTAGRHAAGESPPPFRPDALVQAVYTDPEIAQIGKTETAAATNGHGVLVRKLPYQMNLKAALAGETDGFMKLVLETTSGTVLGASAVGSLAADLLAPLALGIRLNAQRGDLAAAFPAHPGLSEILFDAARDT